MDVPTTVWLIRHGLPETVEGRCYGRHDVCLSPEGIRQARKIAELMAEQPLERIYASPLRRAVDTAVIVAEPHHLNVETLDGLVEIDFGDLEGLTYQDIQASHPEVFESWMSRPTETRFPNGEDFRQMRERVLKTLDAVLARHPASAIGIVAHAGVLRIILGHALSIPDDRIFRLAQRYAAINRIDYFDDGPIVQLVNGETW